MDIISLHIPDKETKEMLGEMGKEEVKSIKKVFGLIGDIKDDIEDKIKQNKESKIF